MTKIFFLKIIDGSRRHLPKFTYLFSPGCVRQSHALEFIDRTAGYVQGNLKPDLHLNQLRKQLLRDINVILTSENCAIIRQYINQLSEINPNR